MTQDIDDLIARLNKGAKPLVIYEGTRNETRKVLADDALRLQVLIRESAAALREQRDEIERLNDPKIRNMVADLVSERDAAMKDAERWRWYVRNQLDREGRLDAWADRNMANDAAIAKEKG